MDLAYSRTMERHCRSWNEECDKQMTKYIELELNPNGKAKRLVAVKMGVVDEEIKYDTYLIDIYYSLNGIDYKLVYPTALDIENDWEGLKDFIWYVVDEEITRKQLDVAKNRVSDLEKELREMKYEPKES